MRHYRISSWSRALARLAKSPSEDLPSSLRGALATKQSIAQPSRLWIASRTGRRFAPSRWLAMTVWKSLMSSAPLSAVSSLNDIDMIRTSKSLNQFSDSGALRNPRKVGLGRNVVPEIDKGTLVGSFSLTSIELCERDQLSVPPNDLRPPFRLHERFGISRHA